MPVIPRLSLLSLLVLAAPHAGAESLADCRRIADANQRLACYDGLDKETPPEKPPAATSTGASLKPPSRRSAGRQRLPARQGLGA